MQNARSLPDVVQRPQLDDLAVNASNLGFEIVEISSSLDWIDAETSAQLHALDELKSGASQVLDANTKVGASVGNVRQQSSETAETLATLVRESASTEPHIHALAEWVGGLESRIGQVAEMLAEVRKSNTLITSIATQVNILAINAKIEAARAGEYGRGFAVVAEEVNALSRNTAEAAEKISRQVEELDGWISHLAKETEKHGQSVTDVRSGTERTSAAMDKAKTAVEHMSALSQEIAESAGAVERAGNGFAPRLARISEGAADKAVRVAEARDRLQSLIELSEGLVQGTVAAGGMTQDQRFIERVTADAAQLGQLLETAVEGGEISISDLFSRDYSPIVGTDPEQVMAPFTHLTDRIFPDIQEAALEMDDRIVFCAAVATGGYLPTHNRKFAKPQGGDPVWNTANCRNRRVFDDRVGAKASWNTEPFLLQVYRRDMGGGEFRMMTDLSSPIFVQGRHWGGLRLAYLI